MFSVTQTICDLFVIRGHIQIGIADSRINLTQITHWIMFDNNNESTGRRKLSVKIHGAYEQFKLCCVLQ